MQNQTTSYANNFLLLYLFNSQKRYNRPAWKNEILLDSKGYNWAVLMDLLSLINLFWNIYLVTLETNFKGQKLTVSLVLTENYYKESHKDLS